LVDIEQEDGGNPTKETFIRLTVSKFVPRSTDFLLLKKLEERAKKSPFGFEEGEVR